jgi:hypothetical protein
MSSIFIPAGAAIMLINAPPIKLPRQTLDLCGLASRDAASQPMLKQNHPPHNAIRGNGHFFLEIGYPNEASTAG